MPYIIKTPREYMPPQLRDAPHWFDNLYEWRYAPYRNDWIEVTLWFPFDELSMPDIPQEYFRRAYSDFLAAWLWLETRFELPFVPKFRMDGQCHFKLGDPNYQGYRNLHALGEFTIGSRKISTTSSSSSSES